MTDPLQNPQIRAAMAQLELAEVNLDKAIANAEQVDQRTSPGGLSDEDIEKIEEHARSADAPKELRELQRKVDDGELSWREIASPQHFNDPEVRAAMSTSTPGLSRAYQLIQEGDSVDDVIDAGATPSSRPKTGDDGDDGVVLEQRDW